jgi:predicted ATPase/DNA-binding CsgD family transcriptional regulator
MVGGAPLIGRHSELGDLRGMLVDESLVTVTGAGGCGKTRLALELPEQGGGGRELVAAMLAGVADEEELLDVLLRAFGARERFGYDTRQVLLDAAAARPAPLLLLLDNCEHLIAPVGSIVTELLAAAPRIRIVATSREPLGLPGERVFCLGPLGLPAADGGLAALVGSEAGRLFVERAARADPAFDLTADSARAAVAICRALDGLPLALCLVASHLPELTVEEIAAQLADQALAESRAAVDHSRHDSLRASLEWSYRLLDARERAILRALSVFGDGFTAEAARAVGAPDLGEDRVRHLVVSLADKGLVAPAPSLDGEERWTLLQTVAEHAAGELAAGREEEGALDRHLHWFEAFAARVDDFLLDAEGPRLIAAEAANIRRALERAVRADPGAAVGIAVALSRYWVLGEHFHEGRAACASALTAGAGGEPGRRAALLAAAAVFAVLDEDYAEALEGVDAALALLGEGSGAEDEAACLLFASAVMIQTGTDPDEGLRHAERAVSLQRGAGSPLGLAYALVNLVIAAALRERLDRLEAAYREFIAIRSARDHPRLRAWAEQAAAWAEVSVGSPRRALEHTGRAIALELGEPTMTYFQAVGFRVQALARLGDVDRARREGAAAMRRAAESGAPQAIPAIKVAMMVADLQAGDLDAAEDGARSLLEMTPLHTRALARETLARIALLGDDLATAAREAGELAAIGAGGGSARQVALAELLTGSVAVRSGEPERGLGCLHLALRTCAELGLERDAAEALGELALAAALGGAPERSARLLAAAVAACERLECAPTPLMEKRLRDVAAKVDGGVDSDGWRTAWSQGEGLSLGEAIDYAGRGRGPRDRPAAGWESLTPIEAQVAGLAAEGLTNPQIAARVFVSRGTVKLHLSNVYRKLEVANRVELARLSR